MVQKSKKRQHKTRGRGIGGSRHFRQLCSLLLTVAMLIGLITAAAASPAPSTMPVVFEDIYIGDADVFGTGTPYSLIEAYAADATLLASATVDSAGDWQITLPPALAATNNTIEFYQTHPGLGESAAVIVEMQADAGDNRYLVLPRDNLGNTIDGIVPISTTYATTSTAIASITPIPNVDYSLRGRDIYNISYDAANIASPIYTTGNLIIFTMVYNPSINPYYKATINNINGTDTEEEFWEEDDIVSISAGTYADHKFVMWATSPNTIAFTTSNDALSASTAFIMPGQDVTLTAIWEPVNTGYIPDSGGSGATSGGGGGSGSVPSPIEPYEKPAPAEPDEPGDDGEGDGEGADGGDTSGSGTTLRPEARLPRFEMGFEDGFIPLGAFNPDHIAYLYGYEEGDVQPDAKITRSEASALIFRILSDPDRFKHLDNTFEFADWEWYYEPVTYLADKGIIKGYDDGSFRPDNDITRAEFVTMICRFGFNEGPMSLDMSDIAGHWAEEYIKIGVSNGWISGYTDGTFKPDNSITRAEVVSIINRLLYRGIEIDDIPGWAPSFWDLNEDHWAYADIMEAAIGHSFDRKDNGFEVWIAKLD